MDIMESDNKVEDYKEKCIKTIFNVDDTVWFLSSNGIESGVVKSISSKIDSYGTHTSYEVECCYGQMCKKEDVIEERCFSDEKIILNKILGDKYDVVSREFKIKDIGKILIANSGIQPHTENEVKIALLMENGVRYTADVKFERLN